jgi:hypothetical protein
MRRRLLFGTIAYRYKNPCVGTLGMHHLDLMGWHNLSQAKARFQSSPSPIRRRNEPKLQQSRRGTYDEVEPNEK